MAKGKLSKKSFDSGRKGGTMLVKLEVYEDGDRLLSGIEGSIGSSHQLLQVIKIMQETMARMVDDYFNAYAKKAAEAMKHASKPERCGTDEMVR